ncbi:MAG: two-component regulator propeller domain-containing protein [Myroides sp.]|nr:two-component regulator propeller domain-containing protein [Myroides sp.]
MKLLLSFSFLSVCYFVYGQYPPVQKLGLEKGLSNNYIMGITQDQKGYIWVSTESGLNRFDGEGFTVYKKNIPKTAGKSINGNELNMLYADKDDPIIWIATQREGLNAFNYDTETFYYYRNNPDDPNSLITNDITHVTQASDGNLWIATYHRGFEYLDKKTHVFTHYNKSTLPQLVDNGVWSLAEDNNKVLYIGHVNSGLSIYDTQSKTLKNYQHNPNIKGSIPGNSVNCIYIDRSTNVWVGTNGGLAMYNRDLEMFTSFTHDASNSNSLLSNFICHITQTDDGNLWVGTENGGISILNLQQNFFSAPHQISFYNIVSKDDKYSISHQTVKSIFQDSYHNIWIGTYGGGLNFISHRKPFFHTWTYSPYKTSWNQLDGKVAWGLCVDNEGRVWVGTDGQGINVFEKGQKIRSFNTHNSILRDDAILSAYRDTDGNLWFGSFEGGVYVYDTKRKELTSVPLDGIKDIRCITEDHQGNIWIGGGHGILVFHPKKNMVINTFNKNNSFLKDNLVRSIYHDKDKNIWVGYFGEGLSVFNPELSPITHYNTGNDFPSNMVHHIYEDSYGIIWVGTSEGLVRFDSVHDSSPVIYNESDGLQDSHIRAIAEGFHQDVWISTNAGISVYKRNKGIFSNFDHSYGVPSGSFMSASVAKGANQFLYFGSQSGVCFFDSTIIPEVINPPPTVITQFVVYDSRGEFLENVNAISPTSNIVLKYYQNTFDISFNVLDFSIHQLMEYSYILKGLDDKWYTVHNSNSISFRNIPHGSYELQIRSRVKNQPWSDQITSLTIAITPPLWLSWWAKALYLLIGIVLIVGVSKFYKRELDLENTLTLEKINHLKEHEVNNERIRFFTNITHELRTPLTLILGPLEDLSSDDDLSEKHLSKVSIIYKSATKLLNLINQILEFQKTETHNWKLNAKYDNLEKLITQIGLKYKELNTKKNVHFSTIIDDSDFSQVYFDTSIISSIVENLLSNAFKYTNYGYIQLILRTITDNDMMYVEIEVKDTGQGIHPEAVTKIFDRYYQEKSSFHNSGTGIGLAIVRNLASLHEGWIQVRSVLGEGSSFCFRIQKYNNLHQNNFVNKHIETKISAETFKHNTDTYLEQIILIIEDEQEINDYIYDSLKDQYKVYAAYNGKQGVEKAFELIPDIIITDVMMPKMDGYEVTKILKDDIRTSHIPIIILTAKDTMQDRTTGYSMGADSYIAKPFSVNLLQSRILNLLELRQRMAEQLRTNSKESKSTTLMESLQKIDREFLDKVRNIIEQNIDAEVLDVNFIAHQMFVSHSTLYRKIKALTDMTATEFIRNIRLKKAEQLLLTGKYTISEITYMVGMNSATYFRQCFKDTYGYTPTEYIKRITNNG